MEGCLAPLMRSKDGRRYCAGHDMWVMTEEEAAQGAAAGAPAPAPPPRAEEEVKGEDEAEVEEGPAGAAPPPAAVGGASARALGALLSKMDQAQSLLARTSDVAESRELVGLIRDCALAYDSVRGLR